MFRLKNPEAINALVIKIERVIHSLAMIYHLSQQCMTDLDFESISKGKSKPGDLLEKQDVVQPKLTSLQSTKRCIEFNIAELKNEIESVIHPELLLAAIINKTMRCDSLYVRLEIQNILNRKFIETSQTRIDHDLASDLISTTGYPRLMDFIDKTYPLIASVDESIKIIRKKIVDFTEKDFFISCNAIIETVKKSSRPQAKAITNAVKAYIGSKSCNRVIESWFCSLSKKMTPENDALKALRKIVTKALINQVSLLLKKSSILTNEAPNNYTEIIKKFYTRIKYTLLPVAKEYDDERLALDILKMLRTKVGNEICRKKIDVSEKHGFMLSCAKYICGKIVESDSSRIGVLDKLYDYLSMTQLGWEEVAILKEKKQSSKKRKRPQEDPTSEEDSASEEEKSTPPPQAKKACLAAVVDTLEVSLSSLEEWDYSSGHGCDKALTSFPDDNVFSESEKLILEDQEWRIKNLSFFSQPEPLKPAVGIEVSVVSAKK